MQDHDKCIRKVLLWPHSAEDCGAVVNGVHAFAAEMLQLQIPQVIKHFAQSKHRPDKSRFNML